MRLMVVTARAVNRFRLPPRPMLAALLLILGSLAQASAASAMSAGAPPLVAEPQALKRRGYALAVDGVAGPATKTAIEEYQRRNDQLVTGSADAEMLSRLEGRFAGRDAELGRAVPDSVPVIALSNAETLMQQALRIDPQATASRRLRWIVVELRSMACINLSARTLELVADAVKQTTKAVEALAELSKLPTFYQSILAPQFLELMQVTEAALQLSVFPELAIVTEALGYCDGGSFHEANLQARRMSEFALTAIPKILKPGSDTETYVAYVQTAYVDLIKALARLKTVFPDGTGISRASEEVQRVWALLPAEDSRRNNEIFERHAGLIFE